MSKGIIRTLVSDGLGTLGKMIALATELMASSAEPSKDEFKVRNISGGELNYRTGNLDDGTDPYGWYDQD